MHLSDGWLSHSNCAAFAAALLISAAFGCRRAPDPPPLRAEPQQTRADQALPAPARAQVPRVLVFAPGPTIAVNAEPESTYAPPEPRAGYSSLKQACTAVRDIMHAQLGVAVSLADSVSYENEFVLAHRTGCELQATGMFSARPDTVGSRSVDGDVAAGLSAAGWADIPRYTADGPDGGSFGLRSRETVCLFRASWDGGDDADSTYVPSDDWEVVGHCALREPGDSV